MCVVVHGSEYGKAVPFDEATTHRGDVVGFPRARLLPEAQAKLMQFLTKVVDLTLECANVDNPSSVKWSLMCHEGFRSSGDVAQWFSYSNQPFSEPPLLDIDAMVSAAKLRLTLTFLQGMDSSTFEDQQMLIRVKEGEKISEDITNSPSDFKDVELGIERKHLDAVADHMALLQTDHAYMRRYIRLIMQESAFKDIPKTDTFINFDCHMGFEIKSLYWGLCVKEEAEHVRDVRRRFCDQIQRGSPLPRQYDRALASLELVLVNHMIERGDVYSNELVQRLGFSHYFTREYQGQGRAVVRRAYKGPLADKLFTEPLFWCLTNLCAGPDMKGNFDHAHLFTFLEDHLSRSPAEERARLDQVLYDQFSELATNHQLLLAVKLNRPQNKAGDGLEMFQTEDRRAWSGRLVRAGNVPQSFERAAVLQRLYEATPPQRRKNATWIERHEHVHSTLSTYWSSMRESAKEHMKDEVVARHMEADLDQIHQAELTKERQAMLDEIASRKIVRKVVPELQMSPTNENIKQAEKKQKVETRPEFPQQPPEPSTPKSQSSQQRQRANRSRRPSVQWISSRRCSQGTLERTTKAVNGTSSFTL